MATRKELTAAVSERCRGSTRAEKARIFDEFVVITGFHRKHAMRLLRRREGPFSGRRARSRIYGEADAMRSYCWGRRLTAIASFNPRRNRHRPNPE